MRVAVIWSRFGPYHVARLNAAAALGQERGIRIVGIEVAENDSEYSWSRCRPATSFERRTVFPQRNYHQLSPREIRGGVQSALNEIAPAAVAINGWSVVEARAALDWCGARPDVGAIVMSETKADDAPRIWWKERLKRHLLRKADAALVGGEKQKDYLVRLGMSQERIFVGYDVVDNAYFRSGASEARANDSALRAQLGLPARYFFACTRFLPRKNVDGLLRAYAAHRETCQRPWDLVIAGSGAEEPALRELESELRLDGVTWAGFIQYEQLPIYYGLASAFIHPAKSEPWGLVLNEAAACGLPLLSSSTVGAAYELVAHGKNGWLFDPFDVQDAAAAMARVSEAGPEQLAAMSDASLAIAKQWSPQRFGTGLFDAMAAMRQGRHDHARQDA